MCRLIQFHAYMCKKPTHLYNRDLVLILFQTVPDFSEPEFSDIDDIESLISLQTDDLSEGTLVLSRQFFHLSFKTLLTKQSKTTLYDINCLAILFQLTSKCHTS